MSEAKSDWQPTAKRFVAFFDIMGFKDSVSRESHEEILKQLTSLTTLREGLEAANNIKNKSGDTFGETKSFTFSDSIIIFSKGDEMEDLRKVLLDSVVLLKVSTELGIPIKGALSYGKITVDFRNSLFFGQPIINAYLLHEELLMYTAIVDNLFESKIKELFRGKKFRFWLVRYNVQMKSCRVNHYILRPLTGEISETIENMNKFYLTVSGKPRQYIDNTLEFLNSLPPDPPKKE